MYNTDNCYYAQVPQNETDWRKVASEFSTQWNFPNCIGSLDGKHVHILPPPRSGSLYYNYKHFNSIVLMALVDACYRFMYVDIGSCGRISDGGVFNSCSLSDALENNRLSIPAACNLPQADIIACSRRRLRFENTSSNPFRQGTLATINEYSITDSVERGE